MTITSSLESVKCAIITRKDALLDLYRGLDDVARKKLMAAVLVASLPIAGVFSYPLIRNAYQKHQAVKLVEQSQAASAKLHATIDEAETKMRNNAFLMDETELQNMKAEVEATRETDGDIQQGIGLARMLLDIKDYAKVRSQLDFRRGENPETPLVLIAREENDLRGRVIGYCEKKRGLRDTVWENERFLKARLYIPPRIFGFELELAGLDTKFLAMIPLRTPELEYRLMQLDKRLFNSLGANLEKHRPELAHALKQGIKQDVRDKAAALFDTAYTSYLEVMPENDKLIWYRPSEHDGKYSTNDLEALLARQTPVVDRIHKGDNALNSLTFYLAELHEQWYAYVSDQHKERTTFSHVRTVTETVTKYDSEGRAYSDTETSFEHYTTDGFKFYYEVTSVSAQGTSKQTFYVGEKDEEYNWSYDTWDYGREEQVGYLRQWKRLHDDNANIIRGGQIGSNGMIMGGRANGLRIGIEPLPSDCNTIVIPRYDSPFAAGTGQPIAKH